MLDGPGDDYERGALDTYAGSALGSCDGFAVPDYRSAEVTVRHAGFDNWAGPYVNVRFESDSWLVRCVDAAGEDKIRLDGSQAKRVECSAWTGEP